MGVSWALIAWALAWASPSAEDVAIIDSLVGHPLPVRDGPERWRCEGGVCTHKAWLLDLPTHLHTTCGDTVQASATIHVVGDETVPSEPFTLGVQDGKATARIVAERLHTALQSDGWRRTAEAEAGGLRLYVRHGEELRLFAERLTGPGGPVPDSYQVGLRASTLRHALCSASSPSLAAAGGGAPSKPDSFLGGTGGYKDAKWGMSPREAQDALPGRRWEEAAGFGLPLPLLGLRGALYRSYEDEIAGQPAKVILAFVSAPGCPDRCLEAVRVRLARVDREQARKITRAMAERYGEPTYTTSDPQDAGQDRRRPPPEEHGQATSDEMWRWTGIRAQWSVYGLIVDYFPEWDVGADDLGDDL